MITLRQVQKQQKQWDINSKIIHTGNGYKLNLRSKGLFANRQILFTASVVLLTLVVDASRQYSNRLAEADTYLTCANQENPPVITKKI